MAQARFKGLSGSTTLGNFMQPLASFGLRLWLSKVFLESAITKIQNWSQTVALFEGTYQVPVLSAPHAALLCTGFELILPIFLALGLGARLPTLLLGIYTTLFALFCDPHLHAAGGATLEHYLLTGLLLVCAFSFGPGKLSLDYFFTKHET